MAAILLQHDQHYHVTYGDTRNWLCLEIYPCVTALHVYAIPHAIVLLGASMTLVGLLPPLCDNGSMLVDGGYRRFSIIFRRAGLT